MPSTRSWPFRRVFIDHMFQGVTRVWWQLEPTFNDPGDYVFQLQVGHVGSNAAMDWQNVGVAATNAALLTDDEQREFGTTLQLHYRVTLTTATETYVSPPAPVQGMLPEHDWLVAREIVRKELLRHRLGSRASTLLKRIRYGAPCTLCLNKLTGEPQTSNCEECGGTGFQVGYNAPIPFQCFDPSPETIDEEQDLDRGTVREQPGITARVIGYPMLSRLDVIVDDNTDERWIVDKISRVALVRNTPVVLMVQLNLLPFSDPAYSIDVGGEPANADPDPLPSAGAGCIRVDHDYGGADALAYLTASGNPIEGATVLAFDAEVYDAASPGRPHISQAAAGSTTTANGRWTYAMFLAPGNYVLQFLKLGEYGPDTVDITLEEPATSSTSIAVGDESWNV